MLSPLDLAGWIGGLLTAGAYILVSSKRIDPEATRFQSLNMVGAALLALTAWHHDALPQTFFNIAWIGFGVQALAATRARRQRAGDHEPPPTARSGATDAEAAVTRIPQNA